MKTIIEPEKVIRVDHSLIFCEYQKALNTIKIALQDFEIQNNTLFIFALEKAKREAFDEIKSLSKPYVVYQINFYYSHNYITN